MKTPSQHETKHTAPREAEGTFWSSPAKCTCTQITDKILHITRWLAHMHKHIHTHTHIYVHARIYMHMLEKNVWTQKNELKDPEWSRSVDYERWGRIWLTLLLAKRWGNCLLSSLIDWNKQVQLHLLASLWEAWSSLAAMGKGEAINFLFQGGLVNFWFVHLQNNLAIPSYSFIQSPIRSLICVPIKDVWASIVCQEPCWVPEIWRLQRHFMNLQKVHILVC